MKKIIRTNNLQKALEDYDALKGQAVSYVSVLPESPNIRNSVYCKQTTTDIEEGRTLTVGELIENFAQETETANHFVIPETYTITYSNDVVKGIEVSGDVAIMYEDEEFTTALATTFNLEDNYIFDVITHVTEMAYYMGDVTNQVLHPVVSFGVIAEVHAKIDRVERELDSKIDNNYNTLDNKIDNSYNTLDNKIDNEIANLAVNFTTNNLVANVATVNNASVTNAVVSSLNVAEIIANGSAGTNGQILGKVNGNLEWQDFSTDNFVVNNITVNNNAVADNAIVNNLSVANIVANESVTDNASIDNLAVNNAVLPKSITKEVSYYKSDGVTPASGIVLDLLEEYSGFGEPGITTTNENFQFLPFTSMEESEYNKLYVSNSLNARYGYAYKNVLGLPLAFIATKPFGSIYFAGQKIIETNLIPSVDGIEITPSSSTFDNSVVTPTLTFTTDPVTNNLSSVGVNVKVSSVLGSSYYNNTQVNLLYGINANGSDIVTNINNTQFASFENLFYNKQSMTDCFITNPGLIVNAPSGYDVWNSVSSMAYTFYNCKVFNQPITIPNSITNMSSTFSNCKNFNQLVTIPDGVTDVSNVFAFCTNFNQPVTIPDGVTNMPRAFTECKHFNQPITIPDSVINASWAFSIAYGVFNQPVIIGNNVVDCRGLFQACESFNQPVTFPDSVENVISAFSQCTNLNQPVVFGNNVSSLTQTFLGCENFNQPVTIPSSVMSMQNMFRGCTNFNQPVSIPIDAINATNMSSMFMFCKKFNQSVTIPNGVTNVMGMLYGCTNFNSPVTFPDSVTDLSATFYDCTKFNQSVTIPSSATVLSDIFNNCLLLAASSVPIHISHEIALGDTSNHIYNCLVNGIAGITIDPSRILNDA